MPGTSAEYLALAIMEVAPETSLIPRWADGTAITEEELRDVIALRVYHRLTLRLKNPAPQRRAMKLLRSLLPKAQREQLRRNRYFIVEAPSGNGYRFLPKLGMVERVARHGRRWFATHRFCIHDDQSDPAQAMPPADLTVAHLLLISADEGVFLATANSRATDGMLWNGGYLRRLRQASVERLQEAS